MMFDAVVGDAREERQEDHHRRRPAERLADRSFISDAAAVAAAACPARGVPLRRVVILLRLAVPSGASTLSAVAILSVVSFIAEASWGRLGFRPADVAARTDAGVSIAGIARNVGCLKEHIPRRAVAVEEPIA